MMNMKKKENIIVVSVIALVVAIVLVFIFINSGSKSKQKEEFDLNKSLKQYGKDFYEEKYYPGIDDKTKLSNFADSGIKISITNIDVITPLDEEMKKKLKKDNCDLDNSIISFYPTNPYGQKDYKIKVELSCKK